MPATAQTSGDEFSRPLLHRGLLRGILGSCILNKSLTGGAENMVKAGMVEAGQWRHRRDEAAAGHRPRSSWARSLRAVAGLLILAASGWAVLGAAGADDFRTTAAPLVKQFCLDCHAGAEAEAGLALDKLLAESSLDRAYKPWQKVAAVLEQGKMPPSDAEQPGQPERQQLAASIRTSLRQLIVEAADDPGPLVIRRLTSAEYAYTIQDLTGLDLDLADEFVDDAVGGEGFTNVGAAQFLHEATLERYLQAARRVANHAVIGSGPLEFFRAPGKTGQELFAIHRISEIYRQHGFRTAAGEGGEPFGLDRYPKAFFTAWRFLHRERLGSGARSLEEIAAQEGVAPEFARHIWSVLTAGEPTFPTAEIVAQWRQLPPPTDDPASIDRARQGCDDIYRLLGEWQTRLARAVGDEEEAAVLSETTLQVKRTHAFLARFAWQQTPKTVRLELVVTSAAGQPIDPVVVWGNPRVRFRRLQRRRDEPQPLATILTAEQRPHAAFGRHPRGGQVAANDLVTAGSQAWSFELPVPEGARGLDVQSEVSLDLDRGENCVVRCSIVAREDEEKPKSVSALLADPQSEAFRSWKAGALEFARLLPQVSHREPAPSDRDPIPPPFDNTYNARERDFFHTRVKYHRDDAFFTEKLIDAATRRRLDAAWNDLLSSFEYHDIYLRFVAGKFGLDLAGRTMAQLDRQWIAALPEEPRQVVAALREHYDSIQRAHAAAEAGHLDEVLQFASRAWRRPLAADEEQRLRSFYRELRGAGGLDHAAAVRSLLVRVLVAPQFLYRAELPAGRSFRADRTTETGRPADDAAEKGRLATPSKPLTDWELASRLSYFLWSSLPDDELTAAAAAGTLSNPEMLARQARRMLADEKSRRLATEFFGQWLGFYQFDRYRGVDPERFPEFNDRLKTALYDEAVTFFEHIVRENRTIGEMLFADYCFLSDELATHYGIKSEHVADRLSRAKATSHLHPGGLLGLGAILTVTSAPLRTSPVKRGDWLLRRVLGTPVPPPPANAGSLPADDALHDGLTIRARLEKHRRDPTCANCHARIDPLGFALENYDALGRWRDKYRDGAAIEAEGQTSDGVRIAGFDGLRSYLKQYERDFHRTLAAKLVGYALGRGELIYDQRLIEEIVQSIADGNDRFADLVARIVTSPQFRFTRTADDVASNEAHLGEDPPHARR